MSEISKYIYHYGNNNGRFQLIVINAYNQLSYAIFIQVCLEFVTGMEAAIASDRWKDIDNFTLYALYALRVSQPYMFFYS